MTLTPPDAPTLALIDRVQARLLTWAAGELSEDGLMALGEDLGELRLLVNAPLSAVTRLFAALAARERGQKRAIVATEGTSPLEHNPHARLYGVHDVSVCGDGPCALHRRTPHHMRPFPQVWRADRGIIERVCGHGVGHPDPDDYAVRVGADDGVHGCCGCCGEVPCQG